MAQEKVQDNVQVVMNIDNIRWRIHPNVKNTHKKGVPRGAPFCMPGNGGNRNGSIPSGKDTGLYRHGKSSS